METQAKIIKSIPVVVEAAKRMGKIDKSLSISEIINSEEDLKVINDLEMNILAQQAGKTDIIEIVTTADNPEEAKDFANHLANAFIDFSVQQKNAHIDEAAEFIQDQLEYYKANLTRLEQRLEEFKKQNLDEISLTSDKATDLLKEYDDIMKRNKTLNMQMEQLKERLKSPENSYIDWVSAEEQDNALTALNTELVQLQIDKEALLIYQTPKSPEVIDMEEQIQKICRDLIKELESKIKMLDERAKVIAEKLDRLPGNDLEYNRINRELKINEDIYSLLNSKYQEAKIKQAEKVKEMSVVEYATLSLKFVEGGKWSKTLLGLVIGLLLGLVVAFVMETLDTSIGAIQDVEEYLKIPVLGVIPHFDIESIRAKIIKNNPSAGDDPYLEYHSELVTQFSPKSPIAESYRSLATNIDFTRLKYEGSNSFIVTSSTMQEGKSTSIVNLALALSQMGHRTLVVGCNLRRPSIYKIFGLDIGPGIKDICLGLTDWRSCVRNINDVALGKMSVTEELLRDGAWSRLNIVTCGGVYHNPSELLNAPKMKEFLDEIKQEFDIVLIDCPPVLPVTDAAIIASKVDGSVLVYQVGKIARGALRRAISHLEAVNANVWGVVLNDFKAEISGFGTDAAYYGKYYGSTEENSDLDSEAGDKKFNVDKLRKWTDSAISKAQSIFNRKSEYDVEEEMPPYTNGRGYAGGFDSDKNSQENDKDSEDKSTEK